MKQIRTYNSVDSNMPAPHLNTIASYVVILCCISRNVVECVYGLY